MRIAIIGAGWNGCHLAIELTKAGHAVTVLEKQQSIFSGCSGQFGIRLHRGPHYPRSKATRESCHLSFERFCQEYSELVNFHEHSIYARAERDAEGFPSKVSEESFQAVCFESEGCQEVDLEDTVHQDLTAAYELDEPSVAVGAELRHFFEKRLADTRVEMLLDTEVTNIRRRPYGPLMVFFKVKRNNGHTDTKFVDADLVINATGYQSLTPNALGTSRPLGFDVVYQPCIAFCYEDSSPGAKPISFIVMDGWFPCLMPSIDHGQAGNPSLRTHNNSTEHHLAGNLQRNYILTHGSYTILGSFPKPEQAQTLLNQLSQQLTVTGRIRKLVEDEMCRFWPGFEHRFHYRGWQGSVLAKLQTRQEFRSSVVFEKDRVIYVFPGKISNIFSACEEVTTLIAAAQGEEGLVDQDANSFCYAKQVQLHETDWDASKAPEEDDRSTCNLQTYQHFEELTGE
ncbi:hypothetical protein ACLMJK_001164 [Lecanora helva]